MNDRNANVDLRPIIMRLVPRKWTVDQALQAIALLQQVIAAIWLVHGEMLGRAILPPDQPAEPPPTAARTTPPTATPAPQKPTAPRRSG